MQKWSALITLSLAFFIIVIDTTIMNVSISVLVVDLNTNVTGVQSAISIYAMVMASLMLIGGRLSDVIGSKRTFLIGLVIYSVGTTLASLSNSLTMMIVGWSVLEGVGAALMIPTLQVLLRNRYSGADLAFAYGIVSAVAAVGAALGPIVGGFFTTFISWRWAFRTELVIAIIVLVMARNLQPDEASADRPKFDYVGALLSVVGWSSIVLGILLAQQYGFFLAKEPFLIGGLEFAPFGLSISPVTVGFGFLMVMLLFRWESRLEDENKDGLFKPSTLGTPFLKPGIAVRFVQMAVTAGFLYVFPLFLQLTFEYNAMQTGLALMPFSLSLLVMAVVGARLSARFYANHLLIIGFVIVIVGLMAIGASIQPGITPQELAFGALFGLGLGLIASQLLNLILSLVSPEQTAEAAGLNSTFEQLGNAIGVALIGTLMLTALSIGMQQGISASTVIPSEAKAPLTAGVEESVQLISDTQLEESLTAAGADEAISTELLDIYTSARTGSFKAAVSLLTFFSLLALVLSLWLPKRKLVETEAAGG
ncbi:MAG TPA: MFS transporter [Anaerolineae bacterium]|nr:MFS transporter [Anaerolineae bacterium]